MAETEHERYERRADEYAQRAHELELARIGASRAGSARPAPLAANSASDFAAGFFSGVFAIAGSAVVAYLIGTLG